MPTANHATERLTARAARLNSADLLEELEDAAIRGALAAIFNDDADDLQRIMAERAVLRAEVTLRLNI